MNKVYDKLSRCYECFRNKVDFKPEIALVLGSGLGDFADGIEVVCELDYHEIEGFRPFRDIRVSISSVMLEMCLLYVCRGVSTITRDMIFLM